MTAGNLKHWLRYTEKTTKSWIIYNWQWLVIKSNVLGKSFCFTSHGLFLDNLSGICSVCCKAGCCWFLLLALVNSLNSELFFCFLIFYQIACYRSYFSPLLWQVYFPEHSLMAHCHKVVFYCCIRVVELQAHEHSAGPDTGINISVCQKHCRYPTWLVMN